MIDPSKNSEKLCFDYLIPLFFLLERIFRFFSSGYYSRVSSKERKNVLGSRVEGDEERETERGKREGRKGGRQGSESLVKL